jgi:hypothetical protein
LNLLNIWKDWELSLSCSVFTCTAQHKKNVNLHPWLKRNSNPQIQCSTSPRPLGHRDRQMCFLHTLCCFTDNRDNDHQILKTKALIIIRGWKISYGLPVR